MAKPAKKPPRSKVPWPVVEGYTATGGCSGTLKWQITQAVERRVIDVTVTPFTVRLLHEHDQLTVQGGNGGVRHYALPAAATVVHVDDHDHELRALVDIKQKVDAWLIAAARARLQRSQTAPPAAARSRRRPR